MYGSFEVAVYYFVLGLTGYRKLIIYDYVSLWTSIQLDPINIMSSEQLKKSSALI